MFCVNFVVITIFLCAGNAFAQQRTDEESILIELKIEPLQPKIGQIVRMDCDFNVTDNILYGVKFYKDQQEFFRSKFENDDPRVFPVKNLHVVNIIDFKSVEFVLLSAEASGTYGCEVLCEAPRFVSKFASTTVTITTDEPSPNRTFVKLEIEPRRPKVGDSLQICCDYNLNSDVFSVKIYKDRQEFYSYQPHEVTNPAVQITFLEWLHGTNIHVKNGTLTILEVTVSASGLYTCKVMGEAPEFLTLTTQQVIEVV